MLIAFSNTKGGTGKSTLAAHLAIWLFDRGVRVGLMDADPQQTAARWMGAAEPRIPVRTATTTESVQAARRELLAAVDVIVADTPGSSSESSQVVTLLADFCVVPLQPSKPDLRAIREALKFVRVAQELHQRPEVVLVLTFTAKGDVQARRLRRQIAELSLPLAAAEVRRLNALRDACDTAVTRGTSRECREATRDLEALFRELFAARLRLNLGEKEVVHG